MAQDAGACGLDFAEVVGTQFGGDGNLWKIDLQKSLRIFLVLGCVLKYD
ncbi:hypothetical protein [Neisseria lactamica]|nr:hypothetical protein [Neisseria lactamica]